MALLPPFLLVFDTTALLAGGVRTWQDFSRLGECFVPDRVLEHVRSLCDHAPEPAVELKAKEFARFYPASGWKKTETIAEHPSLKPPAGHALSSRARLALEVLQCTYGLARRHPESLVVLIANDPPMLQRLLGLNTANLCGVPLTALVQWGRSQRRPDTVNQHLHRMRSAPSVANAAIANRPSNVITSSPERSAPLARPVARRSSPVTRSAPTPPDSGYRSAPQQPRRSLNPTKLLWAGVNWVIVAIAIATLWHIVNPASFNQLWQQLPFVGQSAKNR